MKHLFNLSLLLLALLLPATALAYDFEVDGIYYNMNGNEATVTYKGTYSSQYYDEYSGSVTIPPSVTYGGTTYSVTSIGGSAFSGCTGLTSVTIPNSVTSIGEYAFRDCSGLTSINIPNSVTYIRDKTFYGCTALTSVTIPNSVTSIGEYAFGDCTALTSIAIPNSVTYIKLWAFAGCSGLTSINVENDNPKFDSRNNCNAIIETATNNLILGCMNTVIPSSVTSIGNWAFCDCTGLTNVTIPNSVTYIGINAFCGCTGLTSVSIPNSVTELGYSAFALCTGLTNVNIPNSVTTIGYSAFQRCTGLTSITIPNSLTYIADQLFKECSGLTSVTIPNSVTTIDYSAFQSCTGLNNITIPNSVTSIGNNAFFSCDSLKDVFSYISDPSAITMGSSIFYRYPNSYEARTLHVPIGSVAAYQADTNWNQFFGSIIEMDPVLAESIILNVTTAGLNEGATLQLTATVLPEDCADKTVIWESNNPSVATVDSNGLVMTHSVGTATITAMTTDGSNLNTTCTVTLLPVGLNGDVNGDNNISIKDVTDLIDMLLGGN